ncbi:MAG TPA: M20/M25/M40 family metallo-hydrolase [Terriglobales bacterium]|nr:M20/M25/M40 family metallo-hydrolase [Terriglobales bacterium]
MRALKLALCALLLLPLAAPAQSDADTRKLAHDILQQLIAIPSTESKVGSTPAAEAIAQRLRDAGYSGDDVQVLGPNDKKKNVVARLHGTGAKKPILLLAHLDVVEAPRVDWTTDPFQLVEKDGYFYGRGTEDVKDGDAILTANMIRWKQAGWKPDRDIVMALTADEENGNDNGVDWLVKNHRDLIDAEFCLNTDSGDFELDHGKHLAALVQAAEKWYVDWKLAVTNPGGHSSLPRKDNAIYEIAHDLLNLEKFEFPLQPNAVVKAMFAKEAALHSGQEAADMKAVAQNGNAAAAARLSQNPRFNSLLHTTCVATMIQGGHATNALPQEVHANINCRVLPDMKQAEVESTLVKVFNDPKSKLTLDSSPLAGPISQPTPEIIGAVEKVVTSMWGKIPVFPTMETGATDGKYLRIAGIPTYGVSGVFEDVNDVRAHGKDERIGVEDFYQGVDFYDRLVKTLAGGGQ